jgi:DNA polymerase III subunit delta
VWSADLTAGLERIISPMAGRSGSSPRKPADVLADIKRGKLAPVYILFGSDSAAADELLSALRDAVVQPGMEAFDLETVDAVDLDATVLLQHIRQPPMASKRRLVIVRRIEQLAKGLSKEDEPDKDQKKSARLKEILAGLVKLPDGCAVALTGDHESRLQKAIDGAGLGKFVVDLRQPEGAELSALIQRRAKELGISLEPAAVRLLLDVSGDETTLLAGELEKLATAAEPGEPVTAADVRRLAGQSRQFELNEYVNLVMRREGASALAVLERLREWGEEPVKIVAYIAGAFLRRTAYPDAQQDAKYARLCLLQLYEVNRDVISGHPEPFALLEAFTVCAACPESEHYCPVYADARPPEFCMRRKVRRDRTRGPEKIVVKVE